MKNAINRIGVDRLPYVLVIADHGGGQRVMDADLIDKNGATGPGIQSRRTHLHRGRSRQVEEINARNLRPLYPINKKGAGTITRRRGGRVDDRNLVDVLTRQIQGAGRVGQDAECVIPDRHRPENAPPCHTNLHHGTGDPISE